MSKAKAAKKTVDAIGEAISKRAAKSADLAREKYLKEFDPGDWFHGTRGNFDTFSKDALGETTGAPSARQGFFFVNDPNVAAEYAEISSTRPALRGAAGEEDKYFGKGKAHVEFDRYKREQELKSLLGTNKHMEDYLKKLPETRKYWNDVIERNKLPPEIGIRSDGSKYEKYRTPTAHAEQMLSKIDAKEKEYREILSPKGQKKLNKEIAAKQKELDEIVGYQQDSEAGQNIMPTKLRFKNPMVHDFKGEPYRDVSYNDLIKQAKEKGHDAVIFKNTSDPGFQGNHDAHAPHDVAVVFEPNQIRSQFAKFDPKKKKSGNILDSIAPVAIGGAALGASESWADTLQNPIETGIGDTVSRGLETLDKYTGRPMRAAVRGLLQKKNPLQEALDSVLQDRTVSGNDVSEAFFDANPQLTPEGMEHPLQEPLGVAADMVLDPTNMIPVGAVKKAPKVIKTMSKLLR